MILSHVITDYQELVAVQKGSSISSPLEGRGSTYYRVLGSGGFPGSLDPMNA
jgi:hypothetical protein